MSGSSERAPPWIRAWLRERIARSLRLLILLAGLITLLGGLEDLRLRGPAALLAVIAFRLWDDVQDVEHDRLHHPERALCRLASLRGPRLGTALLLALAGAGVLASGGAITPFAAAVALAAAAYALARRAPDPGLRAVFAHVVLLKAPLLALALVPASTPLSTRVGPALALYGLVGGYELWHDGDARRSPHAGALALLDVIALSAGLLLLALP